MFSAPCLSTDAGATQGTRSHWGGLLPYPCGQRTLASPIPSRVRDSSSTRPAIPIHRPAGRAPGTGKYPDTDHQVHLRRGSRPPGRLRVDRPGPAGRCPCNRQTKAEARACARGIQAARAVDHNRAVRETPRTGGVDEQTRSPSNARCLEMLRGQSGWRASASACAWRSAAPSSAASVAQAARYPRHARTAAPLLHASEPLVGESRAPAATKPGSYRQPSPGNHRPTTAASTNGGSALRCGSRCASSPGSRSR